MVRSTAGSTTTTCMLANQQSATPRADLGLRKALTFKSFLPRENFVTSNRLATTPARRRREAPTSVSETILLFPPSYDDNFKSYQRHSVNIHLLAHVLYAVFRYKIDYNGI
jgi:hypothetical protein